MASKLEKFKRLRALAKAGGGAIVKHGKDKLPGLAYTFTEYGSHAVFGLGTRAMPDGLFGVGLLKPDLVGLGVSGLVHAAARAFKKRGIAKFSGATAIGAGHGILGRLISTTHITVVNGPDGKSFSFK